ncbi:hypothetical protein ACJX0J_012643 [Zea mays]
MGNTMPTKRTGRACKKMGPKALTENKLTDWHILEMTWLIIPIEGIGEGTRIVALMPNSCGVCHIALGIASARQFTSVGRPRSAAAAVMENRKRRTMEVEGTNERQQGDEEEWTGAILICLLNTKPF